MNENKNIKYGIMLSYVSMFISILGTVLVTNRVVNYIGDYNYGLYAFVNSITTWLTVISTSLNASFVRFSTVRSKENNNDTSDINTIYMKLFWIISIVLFLVGIGILSILYYNNISFGKYNWDDSKLVYMLFLLSLINICFTIPSTLYSLYINYKKKFVFQKIITIVISIFNYVGHFFIAYYMKSIVAIAAYSIFLTFLTWIFNYIFSKKILNITFAKESLIKNRLLVKQILIFSGIIIFNSVVDQINSSVDKTLLGFFSIPEDVTKYQLGQNFSTYFMIMSISVSGVFIPKIHELIVDGRDEEVNELYLKISRMQSIILCFVAFGFLSCGKNFVIWWIGESRIDVYYIAITLIILSLCPLTMNSSIEIQRAYDKHKFRAITYFSFAVMNIILSIIFINIFPNGYKIYACLLGTIISRILSHWITMNIYNSRVIKLDVIRYMLRLIEYSFFGLLSFGVVYVLNLYVFNFEKQIILFLINGSIYVLIYVILLLSFDRKYVFNLIKRIRG